MKVLFAIGNAQTSKSVADKYFQMNGEKLEYKDVFYFRALLEEVKRDKSYDRIIISEELEPIKAVTIEEIDQKIFSNIDNITDEVQDAEIAFIGSDRRTKSDPLISRLFNIGVYSLLLGNDRNIGSLCNVIKEPKTKKEAKEYLNLNPATNPSANVRATSEEEVPEPQMAHIIKHYEKLGNDTTKYVSSFETIEEQFTKEQLVIIAAAICKYLPSIVAETISSDTRYSSLFIPFLSKKTLRAVNTNINAQKHVPKKSGILNFLTGKREKVSEDVISESAKMQVEEEAKARETAEKAEIEAKRIREEAEKASKIQMEQLRKEKEEQKAKAEAEKQAKEQEELRKRAIEEQKAKEQELLKQRALAEQKAKAQTTKNVSDEIEIDISALQVKSATPKSPAVPPQQVVSQEELKQKAEAEKQAKEQEELRQKALAEQKAKAEAEKQAKEQEELRKKALAEQKAKAEAEKQAKEQEELRQKALAEQKAKAEAEKQAKEQEELRQKALAEQKAKAEAEKQAKEQEELRQKALAEQKAKAEAEKQAKEQEELRQKYEIENVNTTSDIANIETASMNNSLVTNTYDNELANNFTTALYQLPSDYKKVVAFVGTNKVGTTFIANAVANATSTKGIKTALLDMTKTKGLYYLYNKSDQKRIQIATGCIKNLNEGVNTPLTVDRNKNLLVYTTLPGMGENRKNYKHKTLIDTVKRNCNLLIIDCDFTTPIEYFEQASEIYLVQDMDIIKLQETTAFLREFKNRNIDWGKLNVIINKYVKSSFTPKKIVEVGLAYYNDPQMTYTEEFETIKSYTTVPFTLEDYARYTEDVARDRIVYKNYSIQLREAIEQICRKIYPASNTSRKKGMFR